MSNISCTEKETTISKNIIESLGFNQGGIGRHKCVICAYNKGLEDGENLLLDKENNIELEKCSHGRFAPKSKISSLHENQRYNEGRHKCAICAYQIGYETNAGEAQKYYDEFDEDETNDSLDTYNINSYGVSIDVDTLIKRLNKEKYYIPEFQRDYVWTNKQASKLIESIVMGLPIPSIFIAKDEDGDERYYIIDGQQRLLSLKRFYNGDFKLTGVSESINKANYETLDEKYQEKLGDYAFHVIVIRQEQPDNNNDSIYKIFERINTEGTRLYPQEIRTSAYHGSFSKLLSELVNDTRWKDFIQVKDKRKKHEELILRFLALYFQLEEYKEPMKSFLNIFMKKNRNLLRYSESDIKTVLYKVFDIFQSLDKDSISLNGSNRINTQLLDSIMFGIARTGITDIELIKEKIKILKDTIDNDVFEEKVFWESRSSDKKYVEGRCKYVESLFSS